MGCDIYLFAEIKSDGEWKPFTKEGKLVDLDSGRNYTLFAVLAGVRNRDCVPIIHAPKGLPVDASAQIAAEAHRAQDIGDHSFSWLSLRELLEWDWTQLNVRSESISETCHDFLSDVMPVLQHLGEPESVRIVFWFDS